MMNLPVYFFELYVDFIGVVGSKLKCPVFVANEMSGLG
jgi:hypothetical protein